MGRHLGIVFAGALVVGWSAVLLAVDPPPQKNATSFVNPGTGAINPQIPTDMIHVPNRGQGNGPPGSGVGQMGLSQMMVNDPGVWDEKSWICWWETNRDSALRQVMRRWPAVPVVAAAAGAKPPAERERAVAALVKATHAARPGLRAAAAISLGQMRQADAFKGVLELAKNDPDANVRGMAWVAVGLFGTAEAETALVAAKPRTEFEQLGALAGIGLLDHPSEASFKLLRALVSAPTSPEAGRMAMWALRANHRVADHDFILSSLTPQANRMVLSEGVLALGAIGDARDLELLADLASDGRSEQISDTEILGGGGTYTEHTRTRVGSGVTGGATGYGQQGGPVTSTVRGGGTPVRQPQQALPSPLGARTIYARVSAVLALGAAGSDIVKPVASNSFRARNTLIQNFAAYLDQGGPVYAGASIVSLARCAGQKEILIVRDVLDMGTDPLIGLVHPKSPLRGFAALGIGLYLGNGGPARIDTQPIGTVDLVTNQNLPQYVDLNETLAQRYSNRQESSDLRAACALALGLSGDPGNAKRLLAGAEKIDRRDELLMGYTALALALLHDKSSVDAAGPIAAGLVKGIDAEVVAAKGVGAIWTARAAGLATTKPSADDPPAVPQDGGTASNILGRRAALWSLALTDDPRADALLAGAWSRDRITVQDVARAMGWRHVLTPADALSQIVEADKKGAIEAAMSLGWVMDPDRPSRLGRLVAGNNYHQPQSDWYDHPGGSTIMVRNFPRVADFYLYSGPIGGRPVNVPHTPAAVPAVKKATAQ